MTERHKSQQWIARTCSACSRGFRIREQVYRYEVCAECAAAALATRNELGTAPPMIVRYPDGTRMRTDAAGVHNRIDPIRDLEHTFALRNLLADLAAGSRPLGRSARRGSPRPLDS